MAHGLDLDAPDAPHKVPQVLEDAADVYRGSAHELDAAWQDRSAGAPWRMVANELSACAKRIRANLRKMRY